MSIPDMTEPQRVELLVRSIPNPNRIRQIEFEGSMVTFKWEGLKFGIYPHLHVLEIWDDRGTMGDTGPSRLLEALLTKQYIDDLALEERDGG